MPKCLAAHFIRIYVMDISTLSSLQGQSIRMLGIIAAMTTVAINCANRYVRKGVLVRVYDNKGNEALAIKTKAKTFIPPSFAHLLQSLTVADMIVVLASMSCIGITASVALQSDNNPF